MVTCVALAVAAAHAFCLVRSSAAHFPLYAPAAPTWTREHRLDVPAWLRTLPPALSEHRLPAQTPRARKR